MENKKNENYVETELMEDELTEEEMEHVAGGIKIEWQPLTGKKDGRHGA